jgi:hypothetical protein
VNRENHRELILSGQVAPIYNDTNIAKDQYNAKKTDRNRASVGTNNFRESYTQGMEYPTNGVHGNATTDRDRSSVNYVQGQNGNNINNINININIRDTLQDKSVGEPMLNDTTLNNQKMTNNEMMMLENEGFHFNNNIMNYSKDPDKNMMGKVSAGYHHFRESSCNIEKQKSGNTMLTNTKIDSKTVQSNFTFNNARVVADSPSLNKAPGNPNPRNKSHNMNRYYGNNISMPSKIQKVGPQALANPGSQQGPRTSSTNRTGLMTNPIKNLNQNINHHKTASGSKKFSSVQNKNIIDQYIHTASNQNHAGGSQSRGLKGAFVPQFFSHQQNHSVHMAAGNMPTQQAGQGAGLYNIHNKRFSKSIDQTKPKIATGNVAYNPNKEVSNLYQKKEFGGTTNFDKPQGEKSRFGSNYFLGLNKLEEDVGPGGKSNKIASFLSGLSKGTITNATRLVMKNQFNKHGGQHGQTQGVQERPEYQNEI